MKSVPLYRHPFAFAVLPMLLVLTVPGLALEPVAAGAKAYINSMDGFGSFVTAAFRVKGVPLVVVADRSVADYEIVGSSDSQKAGWAKMIFLKQTGSREEASISVVDLRTSEVVFAYNYNTGNSYRGKQSAAESCAKHLAAVIGKGGRFASSLPPWTEKQIAAARARERVPDSAASAPPLRPITTVTVQSNPPGAEIIIDAKNYGPAPVTATVPSGSKYIVMRREGFENWAREIDAKPGESVTINGELKKVQETSNVIVVKPR